MHQFNNIPSMRVLRNKRVSIFPLLHTRKCARLFTYYSMKINYSIPYYIIVQYENKQYGNITYNPNLFCEFAVRRKNSNKKIYDNKIGKFLFLCKKGIYNLLQ